MVSIEMLDYNFFAFFSDFWDKWKLCCVLSWGVGTENTSLAFWVLPFAHFLVLGLEFQLLQYQYKNCEHSFSTYIKLWYPFVVPKGK